MRAIFIDATARTVTEIDHTGKLADMYEAIKCELVECVRLDPPTDLWIDEEGAINGTAVGFTFCGARFFGNGLILDRDDDGDCVETTASLSDAVAVTRFFAAAEA